MKRSSFQQSKISSKRDIAPGIWVNARKSKPPIGEEVLLTNGEGRRDIGEFCPGSGWMGHKFVWGDFIDDTSSGEIFWSYIPEDPAFTVHRHFR